jgi:predicted HNH restriction endonuclease
MKCIWHLCTNQAISSRDRGKFCGGKCRNKYYVAENRRKMKRKAVEHKGGKCECCGYATSIWALDFHHIDPSLKDFGISDKGLTRSWEKIQQEIDKCILMCKNCHAEIHHGLRQLPRLDSNQESQINSLS